MSDVKLTNRELEIVRMLSAGCRPRQIADSLVVSVRTVNFHIANVYGKLDCSGVIPALKKLRAAGYEL